jgi:hypothetical protein
MPESGSIRTFLKQYKDASTLILIPHPTPIDGIVSSAYHVRPYGSKSMIKVWTPVHRMFEIVYTND